MKFRVLCIFSLHSAFLTVAKLIILSDVVKPPILVTVKFFSFFIIFGSTKIFLIYSGMPSYSERVTVRFTTKAITRSLCMGKEAELCKCVWIVLPSYVFGAGIY